MIETVKAIPGLIKNWKTNSDLIYQLIGCVAGILTIAAYTYEQRPSEVLADIMHTVGATGAGEWFAYGLPLFIAEPNVEASRALLSLAGLAVLTLLVRPLFCARRDSYPIDLQAKGLLGSRAACTMWMLLMFAAQFASLAWITEWLRSRVQIIAIIAFLAALVIGLTYVSAYRLRINTAVHWLTHALVGVSIVVIMSMFALAFAVIGPVLGATSWFLATESNTYSDIRRRVTHELARSHQPTGAVLLPSRTAP